MLLRRRLRIRKLLINCKRQTRDLFVNVSLHCNIVRGLRPHLGDNITLDILIEPFQSIGSLGRIDVFGGRGREKQSAGFDDRYVCDRSVKVGCD